MKKIDTAAEVHIANPPTKRKLLLLIGGALIAALLIVFGAVLPAEYNRDPVGIGKLTGLSRLWAPQQTLVEASGSQPAAREFAAPFRSDVFEIPLAASGDVDRKNALEFKVRMKPGETLVYSWAADGLADPSDLLFDFHGHTVSADRAETVSVSDYKKGSGARASGALTAPLEGIHGWYFRNRAAQPVGVRLKLSGFYQLIPPGQEGNLGRVSPTPQ